MPKYGTTDSLTASGKRFMAEMVALKSKPFVKVGVLQAKFDETKKSKTGEPKKPVTLGVVAIANEFGTNTANGYSDQIFGDRKRKGDGVSVGAGVHIPERSFIRSTVDAKAKGDWARYGEELRKMVVATITTDRALGLMGQRILKDIREKIRSMIPPPNAPSTIERKGSDKPLIDTGQLINGMNYEVSRGANK